ncbi:MAG: hypothetical protein L0241_02900 [Planctomycetia bacterium]|nr:hypothetical protein [Planctomycetia bacterium]
MLMKFLIGGALALTVGLSGSAWALANKKPDNCCFPGSDCCYPGSPCCDDCCYPGSPCCSPNSPCCFDSQKEPTDAGAKKVDCCLDPTCPPGCSPDCLPNCCEVDKVKVTPKPTSAKCDGGKCCADGSK